MSSIDDVYIRDIYFRELHVLYTMAQKLPVYLGSVLLECLLKGVSLLARVYYKVCLY